MSTSVRRTSRRRALLGTAVAVSLLALAGPLASAAPAPAPAPVTGTAVRPAVLGEWPQLQGGPTHTGAATDTTLDRAALQRLAPVWTHPLSSPPVVSGGLVYLSDAGGLSALRVSDGGLVWHRDLPAYLGTTGASVGGGVVVVGGDLNAPARARTSALWGLDTATGEILWTHYFSANLNGNTASTVAGQGVYVSVDGTVSKLSLTSGRLVWTSTARAASTPTVDGGTVLVSFTYFDGRTPPSQSALDASTGATRWTHQESRLGSCWSWEQGTVLVSDHVGYFAANCRPGTVRAFTSKGGRTVWRTSLGQDFVWPLAADADLLFSVDNHHGVVALDRATGAVRWRAPMSRSARLDPPPVVVGDTLLVPRYGAVDLLDTASGALAGSVDLAGAGGTYTAFTAVAEGHVFVVSNDSLIALAPAPA